MNRTRNKLKNRIVTVVSVILAVATVYALIIPALTLDNRDNVYCGFAEHEHSSSCYKKRTSEVVRTLICELEQNDAHIHSDLCYVAESVVFGDGLRCELPEGDEHTHGDMCYGVWELDCGYKSHTHTLACHSNPDADVETPEEFGNTVSGAELIGIWREDILSVVRTQLGYRESADNYAVAPDGVTKNGYTRYGEWYGNKYGEWSGMFAAFCLDYAGVDRNNFPIEADYNKQLAKLKDKKLYHKATDEYKPRIGDLVFFDIDKYEMIDSDERKPDSVGFVYELIYEKGSKRISGIKIAEGDKNDRVEINEYSIIDDTILGYGEIPDRAFGVLKCDCGSNSDKLIEHTGECARKDFAVKIADTKSSNAISKLWNKLPTDVKDAISAHLESKNKTKHTELAALVSALPQISEKTTSVDGVDFALTGPFVDSMQADVSEIDKNTVDGLKEYLKDTDEHLASGAYDIKVVDGDEKAYFDDPIKVAISGLDIGSVDRRYLRVKVYHLVGVDESEVPMVDNGTEVEMMYASIDESGNICFETDDFSVFYFTVDFHYEDVTFKIDGYTSVLLSEVFSELGIPHKASDATSVTFSNEEYLGISSLTDESGNITDWSIVSKKPFSTEEKLTVTFSDGTVLELKVTDNQTPALDTEGTTTVNVTMNNMPTSGSVTVTLYNNGVSTGKTITLSPSNSWKGSFTDLESGNYSLEYSTFNGYIYGVESDVSSTGGYTKVSTFTQGKNYVILYNTNAMQASAGSTSITRKNNVSVSNNRITSTVTDQMKWYYDGGLKSVANGQYLVLANNSAKTGNTKYTMSINSSGRIVQTSGTTAYLRYRLSSFTGTTSSYNATGFSIYEEMPTTTTVSYTITAEEMPYNPAGDMDSFVHNKHIDYLGDGTPNSDTDISGEDYYRLYLDMTGKSEPIDLLMVVDGSSSMETADMEGNMRRDDAITQFLNGSTSSINNNGFISYFLNLNSENNISVVQFYGLVDDLSYTSDLVSTTNVSYTYDSDVLLDWTSTANKFVDCDCKTRSGTNYEAGLRRATEVFSSDAVRNNGHRKVMIFLSDGVPTLFNINANDIGTEVSTGYTLGAGDIGKRWAKGVVTTYTYCKEPSKRAFDDFQLSNPGVTVFTVGVSEDINAESENNNQSPDVLKYMAEQGHGEFYGIESSMSELKLALESIFYPKNIVIADEISKYARYYEEDPDVRVTMTHSTTGAVTTLYENGQLTANGQGVFKEFTYVAGDTSDIPTASTGKIVATFEPEYQFEPEYTYLVSFNVKATHTAYNDYANGGYNAVGDADTDYGSNQTSSLKDGFYSNDNATVDFVVSGMQYHEDYEKPVIQVETEEIIARKEWDDTLVADEHGAIQVELVLKHTVDGITTETVIGDPITLSASNSWTHTFTGLSRWHIISPEYEYVVREINVPEGYTDSYEVTVEDGVTTWIVTNVSNGEIIVQKVDSLGNAIAVAGVTFEVYADEALTKHLGTYRTDADGRFTILNVRFGQTYWLVETVAPPGYYPMDGAQPFKVTATGVDSESLSGNKYYTSNSEGVLLVANFSGYQLPNTGGFGTALPYITGTLLLVCAVVTGIVIKYRRERIV